MYLGQANELVEVGHESSHAVTQTSEQTVDVAVHLGDVDVGVAIFYEGQHWFQGMTQGLRTSCFSARNVL